MRFLMVDRILNLDPGKSITAVKTLPSTDELFLDHFPGFPVVPGVLLTEMMAQASGKCLFAEPVDRGYPMLVKIREASFRTWAKPDQEVHLFAEVEKSTSNYATVRCHAKVDGKQICDAVLFFGFLPKENLDVGGQTPEIFSAKAGDDGA